MTKSKWGKKLNHFQLYSKFNFNLNKTLHVLYDVNCYNNPSYTVGYTACVKALDAALDTL